MDGRAQKATYTTRTWSWRSSIPARIDTLHFLANFQTRRFPHAVYLEQTNPFPDSPWPCFRPKRVSPSQGLAPAVCFIAFPPLRPSAGRPSIPPCAAVVPPSPYSVPLVETAWHVCRTGEGGEVECVGFILSRCPVREPVTACSFFLRSNLTFPLCAPLGCACRLV